MNQVLKRMDKPKHNSTAMIVRETKGTNNQLVTFKSIKISSKGSTGNNFATAETINTKPTVILNMCVTNLI